MLRVPKTSRWLSDLEEELGAERAVASADSRDGEVYKAGTLSREGEYAVLIAGVPSRDGEVEIMGDLVWSSDAVIHVVGESAFSRDGEVETIGESALSSEGEKGVVDAGAASREGELERGRGRRGEEGKGRSKTKASILRVPKTSLWLSERGVVFSGGGAVVGGDGAAWVEGGEFFSLLIFFSLFTRERKGAVREQDNTGENTSHFFDVQAFGAVFLSGSMVFVRDRSDLSAIPPCSQNFSRQRCWCEKTCALFAKYGVTGAETPCGVWGAAP